MKRLFFSCFCLFCFLFSLLFPQICISSALLGIRLWFSTLLPSLFPAMVLSSILVSSGLLEPLLVSFKKFWHSVFSLTPFGASAFLFGILCGFPMGTAVSVQALENGLISRKEAQLLSGVCNHASPMFFGGYILDQILSDHPLHSCLILIFYASPFLWFLLRCFFLHHPPASVPDRAVAKNTRPSAPLPFRTILLNASELMLKIGVCMMIFSILQAIIGSLPFVPASLSAVLALFLEITSGSAAVRLLPLQLCLKTSLIMGGTAFGGLCIAFQSFALLRTQKLSCVQYLADKSAVGMITAALVWILYQIV